MTILTESEIHFGLAGLGIKEPHDLPVGEIPGGQIVPETEAEWDAYQWNPPQYFRAVGTFTVKGMTFTIDQDMHNDVGFIDTEAGDKPTWAELLRGLALYKLRDIREHKIIQLRDETAERITVAYGADTHEDEIRLRLRNGHTEAQDTERERLRQRYSIIKAWIESTDRTLIELESLDLNDDTNWTGETWPPVRGGL